MTANRNDGTAVLCSLRGYIKAFMSRGIFVVYGVDASISAWLQDPHDISIPLEMYLDSNANKSGHGCTASGESAGSVEARVVRVYGERGKYVEAAY